MRATIADVIRHPSWLADWWADLPHRHRWFWREVLFEPGQGWLRWGEDTRFDSRQPWDGEYRVAPPLRRLWLFVRSWAAAPWLALIGYRDAGLRWRLPWREVRPSWRECWSGLVAHDRRRLWDGRR